MLSTSRDGVPDAENEGHRLLIGRGATSCCFLVVFYCCCFMC